MDEAFIIVFTLRGFRAAGITMLLVEQFAKSALEEADYADERLRKGLGGKVMLSAKAISGHSPICNF